MNKINTADVLPIFLSSKICSNENEVKERLEKQYYPSDVYSIFIMLEGVMNAEDETSSYSLKKGMWHIHQGGCLHINSFSTDYAFCCIMFQIGNDEILLNTITKDGTYTNNGKKVESLVSKLIDLNKDNDSNIFLLNSTLYQLIDVLKECSLKTSEKDNLALRIKLYLEKHYDVSITNEMLSTIFFYSSDYLNDCFMEHYGTSIHKYQTIIKVNESIELMKTNKYNLNEISMIVGFNDYSTFYRTFTQIKNVSPTEYMKGLKK